MNFFPNLQAHVKDDVDTQNITYNGINLPTLPPVGYFANKNVRGLGSKTLYTNIKSNIENVCNPSSGFICKYSNIKIGTDPYLTSAEINDQNIKKKFTQKIKNLDLSFLNDMNNVLCQLPNIMVMLG